MTANSTETDSPDDLELLLVHLADHGYADQVGSWMSPDVINLAISGPELLDALPEGALNDLAAGLNLSLQDYADHLAQELPVLVDSLSPQGELTDGEDSETALWALAGNEPDA
ncbi:YidB family protein [Streptomyces sp. NBC_00320]|nr:YidB family protein [Streptomyces sp. NBC_00320]